MFFELEVTIRKLYLNLLVVKNKSIKLPFVTWNKISLPIWSMNYFKRKTN